MDKINTEFWPPGRSGLTNKVLGHISLSTAPGHDQGLDGLPPETASLQGEGPAAS